MNAEIGDFENNDRVNKISYLQQKQKNQYNFINHDEHIEVVIIDLFGEYKNCVKSCLSKAIAAKNINFLIIILLFVYHFLIFHTPHIFLLFQHIHCKLLELLYQDYQLKNHIFYKSMM